MSYTTLITAEQLRDLRPAPVIVDTSFDLADANAGEASWREGHLPGSFYLHLDRDLSAVKTGSNGRHPLPDRNAFAITLARCGITPTTQVVVLDRQGGTFAPRLWWMLRWMGHAEVAMLDGGLAAWTAAGGALTAEATPAAPATPTYPERASLTRTTSATELQAALGRVTLLDARAGERFRGDVEPLDRAAGHIPGALNRFFKDNLDAATGRFKPVAQLRAEFTALIGAGGVADAVHQCGSGVTACHNLLAMEHAGLAGSALYPGSWSEWSSNPSRPVAQGA